MKKVYEITILILMAAAFILFKNHPGDSMGIAAAAFILFVGYICHIEEEGI